MIKFWSYDKEYKRYKKEFLSVIHKTISKRKYFLWLSITKF